MTPLQIKTVSIDSVTPNSYNPNTMSDTVFENLAADVAQDDMDQPVIVRPMADGSLQIVDGEHRWRASKAAGKTDILVSIREMDEEQAKIMTIRRNVLRGELDRSKFTALVKGLSNQGKTVEDVRKAMGMTERNFARSFISQTQETKDMSSVLSMAEKNQSVNMLVANLSQMIREIIQVSGETLQSGYLCFAFKGHTSLLISMDSELNKAVTEFVQVAKHDKLTQKEISFRLADALRSSLD